MNEVLNGQTVPALGQWQGVVLIVSAFAVAHLIGSLRKFIKSH